MQALECGRPKDPLEPPFIATVPNMLRWIANQYEDQEAQVRGAQRLTFRTLERQSALLACGMLARGITKGSRVAILMPNGPQFTIAFMAASRIGAIAIPISTLFKARELGWALRHGDIQLLMTATNYLGHDYLSRLEEAFPELAAQASDRLALGSAPYLRLILTWGAGERPWALPGIETLSGSSQAFPEIDEVVLCGAESEIVPSDLLCIIFTSGSSAEPKAVVHNHGAVLRVSWQKAQTFWSVGDEGDRLIGPRPQFWVAGLAATLFQVLLKGCCLLDPDITTGPEVLRLIETEGATGACGNLPWLKMLSCDASLAAAGYHVYITALECAVFASSTPNGPQFLNPIRALREPSPKQISLDLLPHTYGMTETIAGHTSIPSGELLNPERAGFCGRPMPGVTLRICDADGAIVERGEVGEIQVAGYCMMHGIYKKERFETFTEDGYYRTGDLAVMDQEGYIKFQSRMGEMLKINGANVAPAEVESCINAFPHILRSAVTGISKSDGEIRLVAAVEVRPGRIFDEALMRMELHRDLSSYKVPQRIFALLPEDFPLSASGKVRKPLLAELLQKRITDENAIAK